MLLFDAIERIPVDLEYQCIIVGNGPESAALKDRYEKSSKIKEHVSFIGNITYNQMEEEYCIADALIMPSIRETTGSVVLEAMARGIPVITTDAFGAADIIDEQCGWLYTGTTKDDFVNNLKNAMMSCIQNPELRNEKARNSYKKARLYTWHEKAKTYTKIYKELIEENSCSDIISD